MDITNLPDRQITLKNLGAIVRFIEDAEQKSVSLRLLLALLLNPNFDRLWPPKPLKDSEENKNLESPISEWAELYELPVRSRKVMKRLNISTLKDLINHTEKELRAPLNSGTVSVASIKDALAKSGLCLKAEV